MITGFLLARRRANPIRGKKGGVRFSPRLSHDIDTVLGEEGGEGVEGPHLQLELYDFPDGHLPHLPLGVGCVVVRFVSGK